MPGIEKEGHGESELVQKSIRVDEWLFSFSFSVWGHCASQGTVEWKENRPLGKIALNVSWILPLLSSKPLGKGLRLVGTCSPP